MSRLHNYMQYLSTQFCTFVPLHETNPRWDFILNSYSSGNKHEIILFYHDMNYNTILELRYCN